MADVQISGLTADPSATDGDMFIINKSDSTTRKIDFKNLAKSVGGSNAPIFYNFSGNGSFTTEGWDETEKSLFSVASDPIQMPSGTNAAIIYCEHGFTCLARSGIESGPGQSYTRIGKGFDVAGAGVNVLNGGGTNSVAMGIRIGFPHEKPAEQGGAKAEAQGISHRNIKLAAVTYTEGASLTITSTGTHICSKQVDFKMSVGRVLLIPFNSDNSPLSLVSSFLADDELDGIMPPVTPEENESALNNLLRGRMRFLLDQGDNAVQYDPNLSNADKNTLIAEMGNLLALKSSTDTYENVSAEVDRIYGVMGSILAFKFDWQSSTGKSFL